MVFPDNREDVDAGRSAWSETFNNFSFRIDVPRFPRLESDHDLVAATRFVMINS